MIVQSKYDKTFISNDLTRLKYDELHSLACLLLNHKNKVSRFINNNLMKYLEYNLFAFQKEMRELYHGKIPSSFGNQVYQQVFICYQNKFNAVQKQLKFENISYICCETYKRDTKKNKKGEFKKVNNKKTETPLSKTLTYLSRYGNENTMEYIKSQLDTTDVNKKVFYETILRCIDKFGFTRLYNLAVNKRQRVIKHHSEKPIEFKSLSFRGRSRKTKIVDYNKHYGSVINSYISLSGFGRKSMDIPVKFSKEYHGKMQEYAKNTNDYEYAITFNEKQHQVNIHLCKDGERYIPQAGNNVVGIDVNCKHNLFSLSNHTTYDYNRQLVNDFCELSLDIDKLKERDKTYKIGKRKQFKFDKLKLKMIKSEQQLIANMCKELRSQGVNHIVMEDLDNGFGKCYVKDKDNNDINYNRKVKFLGLSSLKQEVEHIGRKYNIAGSTVHARYTCKMRPGCGCI